MDGIVCIPGTCFQNEKPPRLSSEITTYNDSVNTNRWVLYSSGATDRSLIYLDPNTLKRYKNRINIDVKYVYEKKFLDKNPKKEVKVFEQSMALDCASTFGYVYKTKSYDWEDKLLNDSIYGDFESVQLNFEFKEGSIGNFIKILACDTDLLRPLLEASLLKSESWKRFYTIEDGVDLYFLESKINKKKPVEVFAKLTLPNLEIAKVQDKIGVTNSFEEYTTTPKANFMVSKIAFDCNGNFMDRFSNYFDSEGNLISYGGYGYFDDKKSKEILKFTPLIKGLPLDLLSSKLCKD